MDEKVMQMLAQILENQTAMESRLNAKIDSVQILVEDNKSEIKALADELITQREQNEREHNQIKQSIKENTSLLKSAIEKLSEETAHVRIVK